MAPARGMGSGEDNTLPCLSFSLLMAREKAGLLLPDLPMVSVKARNHDWKVMAPEFLMSIDLKKNFF